MALFGKYFEYNGHNSKEFGLMMATFDEIDEYVTGLERNLNRGEMNRYRTKPSHYSSVYSDTLSFDITMVKDDCTAEQPFFTRTEFRRIAAWLTEPEYPTWYHMVNDEQEYNGIRIQDEDEYYRGVFSNIQTHAAGEMVGITATFTCDSPFSYSEEYAVTLTSTETKELIVDTDTDFIYPKIELSFGDTSEVIISNTADSNHTLIITPPSGSKSIIMDCEKLTIKDNAGGHLSFNDLGIKEPDDIYWPRLVKGSNPLVLTGNGSATITYRECRKVGAY